MAALRAASTRFRASRPASPPRRRTRRAACGGLALVQEQGADAQADGRGEPGVVRGGQQSALRRRRKAGAVPLQRGVAQRLGHAVVGEGVVGLLGGLVNDGQEGRQARVGGVALDALGDRVPGGLELGVGDVVPEGLELGLGGGLRQVIGHGARVLGAFAVHQVGADGREVVPGLLEVGLHRDGLGQRVLGGVVIAAGAEEGRLVVVARPAVAPAFLAAFSRCSWAISVRALACCSSAAA